MIEWTLFLTFARIGLFTLGGGSATIPYLLELPERFSWISAEQLAVIIAVGESAPGPGGVNMASYIGFVAAGVPGVLSAVAGLCLPSFVIITVIAICLQSLRRNQRVQHFFYGLRPAVVAVIVSALLGLMELSLLSGGRLSLPMLGVFLLCSAALWLPRTRKIPPIAVIGLSAAAGMLLQL